MQLKRISIQNFRNLNLNIEFPGGISLISAPNGSGKSNLLDIIYFLTQGRFFKRFGNENIFNLNSESPFVKVTSIVESDNEQIDLEVIFSQVEDRVTKSFFRKGIKEPRSKVCSYLKVVFFSPEDSTLATDSPDQRRHEIDSFLSQIDDEFSYNWQEYQKVVKNRNSLLKQIANAEAEVSELNFWNEKLIEFGSVVIFKRLDLIEKISTYLNEIAKDLFAFEIKDFEIKYISNISTTVDLKEIQDSFRKKLERNSFKELAAKKTLYGPQRDDLEFLIATRPLKLFGSRGQQRIAAVILKIALWRYLKDVNKTIGMLLLDDLFSELDENHRGNLEKFLLKENVQTIITTTTIEEFSQDFLSKINRLNVSGSNVFVRNLE